MLLLLNGCRLNVFNKSGFTALQARTQVPFPHSHCPATGHPPQPHTHSPHSSLPPSLASPQLACKGGHELAAEAIVTSGADIHAANVDATLEAHSCSALHSAAEGGSERIVALLLSKARHRLLCQPASLRALTPWRGRRCFRGRAPGALMLRGGWLCTTPPATARAPSPWRCWRATRCRCTAPTLCRPPPCAKPWLEAAPESVRTWLAGKGPGLDRGHESAGLDAAHVCCQSRIRGHCARAD